MEGVTWPVWVVVLVATKSMLNAWAVSGAYLGGKRRGCPASDVVTSDVNGLLATPPSVGRIEHHVASGADVYRDSAVLMVAGELTVAYAGDKDEAVHVW